MLKICVTGATSFVGTHLIQQILYKHSDAIIYAVIRPYSSNLWKLSSFKGIKIIECNLNDPRSLERTLPTDLDYVYLLAWRGVRGKDRYDENIQKSNYEDTVQTYQAFVRLRAKTIVTIGSQAEFGDFSEPANYLTVPHPTNPYGKYKLEVFNVLSRLSANDGIQYKHGRIFSSYGPGDDSNTLLYYLISQFLQGKSVDLTRCIQQWDFIYIDDCAKAILEIGEKGKVCHPYSIGSGDIHPLKYYVERIRSFFSNTIVNYGVVPYKNKQPMFLGADIKDLVSDTGFFPQTDFSLGIRNEIEYIKEKNK